MRVATTVSINVDLSKVYELCTPLDKTKCKKEIASYVRFMLDLRATDQNGGWTYPCEEYIAGHLIEFGYATGKGLLI